MERVDKVKPVATRVAKSTMTTSRSQFGWPHAFAVVAVVVVIAIAVVSLAVIQGAREGAQAVAQGSREAVAGIERIAAAFKTGTIRETFFSYATAMSGSNYLQFATLNQTEVFEREDSATALWGQLELPAVIVRATAPVEYTYFLDFEGEWSFRLVDDVLTVIAPPIEYNQPAIDASALEFEIRQDSLLRDEEAVLAKLKSGLVPMARQRARSNLALVRELGRNRTRSFIETWLLQSFGESSNRVHVEVLFADEPAARDTPESNEPLRIRGLDE